MDWPKTLLLIKKSTIVVQSLWNFVKIFISRVLYVAGISAWLDQNCWFFINSKVLGQSTFFSSTLYLFILPRNIFLDESNPAAKIIALRSPSSLLQSRRQANREIVDCVLILSVGLFPGTVSMTTKSIGDSELRPI